MLTPKQLTRLDTLRRDIVEIDKELKMPDLNPSRAMGLRASRAAKLRSIRYMEARIHGDVPSKPQEAVEKLGLYPLSSEDVLVSVALFRVILQTLISGTEDERRVFAEHLQAMWDAPYV